MFKLANFSLVVVTLVTASVLYNLEHATRAQERAINKATAEMMDKAESIKLLKAEWSSLTRPERIQKLAVEQLGMKPLQVDQIVTGTELPARLQDLVKVATPTKGSTIDDLLKKMQ
jgi:cell division protein FtsL